MLVSNAIDVNKLLFTGVLFGSRALGVAEYASDYDIAITNETYTQLLASNNLVAIKEGDVGSYFKIVPPHGAKLITGIHSLDGKHVHLLVVNDYQDMIIVRKAVSFLKDNFSAKILKSKHVRIPLYQDRLLHEGFVYSSKYRQLLYKFLKGSTWKKLTNLKTK